MNKVTKVRKFIALICALCLTAGTITPQLVYAEGLAQTEGEVPSIQTEEAVQTETAAQQMKASSSADIARQEEDSGTTEAQVNRAETSGRAGSSAQKETQQQTASSQGTTDAAAASTDDVESVVISSGGENGSGTAPEDGIDAIGTSNEEQELTAELDEATLAAADDNTDAVDAGGINLASGIHLADGTYQPYLTGYRLSYLDGNDYKTITSDTVVPVYTTLKMTKFRRFSPIRLFPAASLRMIPENRLPH